MNESSASNVDWKFWISLLIRRSGWSLKSSNLICFIYGTITKSLYILYNVFFISGDNIRSVRLYVVNYLLNEWFFKSYWYHYWSILKRFVYAIFTAPTWNAIINTLKFNTELFLNLRAYFSIFWSFNKKTS